MTDIRQNQLVFGFVKLVVLQIGRQKSVGSSLNGVFLWQNFPIRQEPPLFLSVCLKRS